MFSRRTDCSLEARAYLISPKTIETTEKAAYWGKSADRAIKECKEMIEKLEEYKRSLFERVQEIETAPYHSRILLKRDRRGYGSDARIFYQLIALKIYDVDGIDPVEISRETFFGQERHKAIAAFKAYQKTHPGIEAVMDIEKSKWER